RAQPGIAVRRQVGRVDAAEGRVDPLSSGERFGGIGSVATCAISRIGQRLAARDVLRRRLGVELSLELGMCIADDERSAQKQAGENRPHVVSAPIGLFGRYSAKAGSVATSYRFAPGL